ncbi:alpha/beta hydrolase [Flammeovirga sp. SubArs3]|uniref:alpha/beta hydrolase n=1 Tax=Flammeovirga sp. SubArs3 TaxID=2995316 RepID=UPI00248CB3EA|nr:alpha/beta hydrolase [Flammeovirga sp. SubArs3]
MKTVVLFFSILLISVVGLAQEKAIDKNVVFIHGAWSTGIVWSNFENYFSGKEYNTISPTFNYHSTERNDSLIGVSMEDYVSQIRDILKSFENPPIVVAHSMGCIVVQRLAMEGLIGKMILIAPPANYGMMPPSESIKSVKWVNSVKHLKNNLTKPTFEQAVNGMLNNLSNEKQKEVYSNMTYESGLVMKEMIWIKNIFGKKPNKIKYSQIDIPVLLVSGGIDNASPLKISEKLMKKYKSKVELKQFENNAHWMMEENNWKETAEYISKWAD